MTTKADIIAAIQAVADATGDTNIQITFGTPGAYIKNIIDEIQATGRAWVPEPKPWATVIEGLADWLDGGGVTPGRVKVSVADTVADFLGGKLVAGAGVVLTLLNPGGNEQLRIAAAGGLVQLPTFRQAAEPVLAADDDQCIWVDTDDGDTTYLVFRRGAGDQVKVELS